VSDGACTKDYDYDHADDDGDDDEDEKVDCFIYKHRF